MKTQAELKQDVAKAAFEYVRSRVGDKAVIGIGTGSTANCFIDLLAGIRAQIEATVASSEASAERLRAHGIPVFDLNAVDGVVTGPPVAAKRGSSAYAGTDRDR